MLIEEHYLRCTGIVTVTGSLRVFPGIPWHAVPYMPMFVEVLSREWMAVLNSQTHTHEHPDQTLMLLSTAIKSVIYVCESLRVKARLKCKGVLDYMG